MAIRKSKSKVKAGSKKNGLKMINLKCVFCKNETKCDNTVKAVLCSHCTARLAGSPEAIGKFPKPTVPAGTKKVKGKKVKKVVKKKVVKRKKATVSKPASKTSGWGRGWHLKKKFVAPSGEVYKFGELVKKK